MAPGTVKRSIVTLISFYLFNGNLLLICHSCCSKSGHFGKMEAFTLGRVTSYLIKAWGARGEHIYTIMETIQEHITVERERLKQASLD